MLKLCENLTELDFLPADPFCAKITAFAMTYGFGYDFARFYIQGNNAALCRIDGNITLWANDNADYTEMREFLDIIGFSSIQAEESKLKALGYKTSDSSFIVRYGGKAAAKPADFKTDADFKKIYALLTESGFEMGEYRDFLSDVCARLNKGTCTLGATGTDELRACAFRLFEGNKSVLLGAVATSPKHRGKGIASALVPYMAQGKKPSFLFCRNDSLLDFYTKCSFEKQGRWAIYLKEVN